MSYLNQRISKLEASNSSGKWVVPDKDGHLPDNFNPRKDNILRVTIRGVGDTERRNSRIYWKNQVFEPNTSKTVTIGGELPK